MEKWKKLKKMFPKKQKSSKKVQDVLCLNVKKENKVQDEKAS